VFRLYGHDGAIAYLKAVAPQHRAEIGLTSLLRGLFPQHIPQVLAANESEGLLLMADHGGKAVFELTHSQRRAVLKCYARMQAEWHARPSSLPTVLSTIDPSELACRLHDFLKQEGTALLSRENNVLAMSTFQKSAMKLRSSLATAGGLPKVLEHGDLHAKNIAVLADGTPVLLDWSEAVVGPLGMSLGFLFGGCASFINQRCSKHGGAALYIETLARKGVGSYGLVSDLHHGAIAGVVHAICQASLLVNTDARFESFAGQLVMGGMADLNESLELI